MFKSIKKIFNKINHIENAGGCVVSKNILNGQGRIKWVFREESINPSDNGWRLLSEIDDDDFINNPDNMTICDFNTVAQKEPLLFEIYKMPIGTDLELITEGNKTKILNCLTDKFIN